MGDSRNEEDTNINDFRAAVDRCGGMPVPRLPLARRPDEPNLPARGRPVFQPLRSHSPSACEPCGAAAAVTNTSVMPGPDPPMLRPLTDSEEANYEETNHACSAWNIARQLKRLPHRRMLAICLEFPLPSRAKRAVSATRRGCCRRPMLRSVFRRHGRNVSLLPMMARQFPSVEVHRASVVPLLLAADRDERRNTIRPIVSGRYRE